MQKLHLRNYQHLNQLSDDLDEQLDSYEDITQHDQFWVIFNTRFTRGISTLRFDIVKCLKNNL